MEYEKIKQLMEDMGNSKLSEIEIDFPDGTKISMKKEEKEAVKLVEVSKEEQIETEIIDNKLNKKQVIDDNSQKDAKIVKSPMVGTFYTKPSPDAKPYVEVGTRVKKGDVLCIVEAMKLMNEIESEFDGEVVEVLVNDGEAVEYGMPLFKIKCE